MVPQENIISTKLSHHDKIEPGARLLYFMSVRVFVYSGGANARFFTSGRLSKIREEWPFDIYYDKRNIFYMRPAEQNEERIHFWTAVMWKQLKYWERSSLTMKASQKLSFPSLLKTILEGWWFHGTKILLMNNYFLYNSSRKTPNVCCSIFCRFFNWKVWPRLDWLLTSTFEGLPASAGSDFWRHSLTGRRAYQPLYSVLQINICIRV